MRKAPFMFLALLIAALAARADIVCGDWNLKWFPSGRAEHRAKPEIEARTVKTAGASLAAGFAAASERKEDPRILFFQEARDESAARDLVSALGDERMKLAAVSAFKTKDNRLDWQQCGIAGTLPVIDAGWSRWRFAREKSPPRGYAWAIFDAPEGPVLCFSVHLKSNYGATTPEQAALDRGKRENAVEQLVDAAKRIKSPDGRTIAATIVGGDFNVDPSRAEFANERTLAILEEAGFVSCFPEDLPPAERITHPGRGKFADTTFDYVLARPSAPEKTTIGAFTPISDHRPVFTRIPMKTPNAKKRGVTRASGGASRGTGRGRRGSPPPTDR